MPEGREAIPRELERDLLIEAGYRCAIPTCRTVAPLEIDHIDDYAGVKEHKFENMIVLCRNCHGLKGDKRRQLDRKALGQYKANLSVLNNRYGDLERRVLQYFADNADKKEITLSGGMGLQLSHLIRDGYLERLEQSLRVKIDQADVFPMIENYRLTQAGREFINHWLAAQPLDDTEAESE